eukprot:598475-Prorocentrum_minimum.AAC.2
MASVMRPTRYYHRSYRGLAPGTPVAPEAPIRVSDPEAKTLVVTSPYYHPLGLLPLSPLCTGESRGHEAVVGHGELGVGSDVGEGHHPLHRDALEARQERQLLDVGLRDALCLLPGLTLLCALTLLFAARPVRPLSLS